MATFLLVHGGLHGGWCWEALTPCLAAKGHTVLAPDLPGMGASAIPASQATLAGWADFIIDLARVQAAPPILVGHSRGGIVLSAVAECAPEVCAGLIYVTAMLLQSGESMMGYAAAHMPHVGPAVSIDNGSITTHYDAASAHRTFYNRTDPAISQAAFARLCPEPIAPNVTPLQISDERFGSVPRAYVECSEALLAIATTWQGV